MEALMFRIHKNIVPGKNESLNPIILSHLNGYLATQLNIEQTILDPPHDTNFSNLRYLKKKKNPS